MKQNDNENQRVAIEITAWVIVGIIIYLTFQYFAK
jgi:hypothetical protein